MQLLATMKILFVGLLLFVACLGTYWNSLQNDFLMDDFPMLLDRGDLPLKEFLQLEQNPARPHIYFRPVIHWVNYAESVLFKRSASSYHLLNLFLLFFGGLTLYIFLARLFGERESAFLVTLLFCCHPINGLLVNYKNATGYGVLILFLNLSLILALLSLEKKDQRYLFPSLACFIISLLCHESVVVYPLYLAAVLRFFKRYPWKEIFWRVAPYVFVLFLYVIFHLRTRHLVNITQNTAAVFSFSGIEYILNYMRLLAWYLEKLVTMQGIVLIWEVPQFGKNPALWPLLVIIGVLVSWLLAVRYQRIRVAFGLSWLLTGFIPIGLGCITRREYGFYIEPHWLFYSSIGAFVVVSQFLWWLRTKLGKKIWLLGMTCYLIMMISTAWTYNWLWGQQKRYCLYWGQYAPENNWRNFWLGISYMDEGDYARAKTCFLRNLKRGKNKTAAFGNLGIIEYRQKNYDRALEYFKQALMSDPLLPQTYDYLGRIYGLKGETSKAKMCYQQSAKLRRHKAQRAASDNPSPIRLIE